MSIEALRYEQWKAIALWWTLVGVSASPAEELADAFYRAPALMASNG